LLCGGCEGRSGEPSAQEPTEIYLRVNISCSRYLHPSFRCLPRHPCALSGTAVCGTCTLLDRALGGWARRAAQECYADYGDGYWRKHGQLLAQSSGGAAAEPEPAPAPQPQPQPESQPEVAQLKPVSSLDRGGAAPPSYTLSHGGGGDGQGGSFLRICVELPRVGSFAQLELELSCGSGGGGESFRSVHCVAVSKAMRARRCNSWRRRRRRGGRAAALPRWGARAAHGAAAHARRGGADARASALPCSCPWCLVHARCGVSVAPMPPSIATARRVF
jgi:hypothetical protein